MDENVSSECFDISFDIVGGVSSVNKRGHIDCIIEALGFVGCVMSKERGVCQSSAVACEIVAFSALNLAVEHRRQAHGNIGMSGNVQNNLVVVVYPVQSAPYLTAYQFFGASLFGKRLNGFDYAKAGCKVRIVLIGGVVRIIISGRHSSITAAICFTTASSPNLTSEDVKSRL